MVVLSVGQLLKSFKSFRKVCPQCWRIVVAERPLILMKLVCIIVGEARDFLVEL